MIRKLLVPAIAVAAAAIPAGVAVAGASPTVRTGKATRIAENTALLGATVNPNGASTTYYFQWGLTTSYGANSAPRAGGAGVRAVTVHQTATGLVQGTTYHYRVVATNQFGTTVGADRSFKTAGRTPPGAVTGAAGRLSANGATLLGVVYPQGLATTWWFQWGTSSGYVYSTAAQKLAASSSPTVVSFPLQSLQSGAVYHYRLVASHGGSAVSYGSDSMFMTYPFPLPVPRVQASTKPFRARSKPYVLTTTGRVNGPATIPWQFGCNGNVTIRFFRGLKQVGFTLAGIQPNCSFSARTVFQSIPGGRRLHPHRPVELRVVVRSISNKYLATNKAPNAHVMLG